uniref:ATP-dependent Clp protease proteolytic subunit n=1 Tax=Pandorina morum TaxID=33099 RepID=A0A6C0RWF9_PANMO|nr:ATP-dependent Clp protease proteolytic subunit [Pandorina morum]
MPIGVPRIIYCWGEELPAQWTDIYNFIFRRRMVFLMQYLDDELCNQICGLLINIHMEDRSKELEKKEMEKSGSRSALFKTKTADSSKKEKGSGGKRQSVEDLLTSDQDFGIEDNYMLEQYTLQKITTEWLNWNAQFFDYSDEDQNLNKNKYTSEQSYLFYLANILSKDFSNGLSTKEAGNLKYGIPKKDTTEMAKLIQSLNNFKNIAKEKTPQTNLDVYSPFRLLANFAPQNYNLEKFNLLPDGKLNTVVQQAGNQNFFGTTNNTKKLIDNLALKQYTQPRAARLQITEKMFSSSEKALSQRNLKREYNQDKIFNQIGGARREAGRQSLKAYNYLDFSKSNEINNMKQPQNLYRKQTERVIQEEESKKVFMIINSFGGSVGNGITVHDALQFIKAGSLTLALGVAASAASLALAGGTIGERYVTEGCHTMIHQPEGGLNGQASDIWIDSQEIMKIRLDVAEIYSLSTYRPRHKILRDLDRDFYLTAMETIYYGLADEIATNDVMRDIVEMTSKVWDYHDSKQQRLLETRESQFENRLDTQTQN